MALSAQVAEIVEKSNNPLLGKHDSWERVLLGDIAKIQNGYAFQSSLFNKQEGVPLIRIRDVGKDVADTNYTGEYDPEYLVKSGDLLIGMDGDFNCARWKGPNGLLNQRVCRVILTSETYLPKLLDYALPGYLNAINEMTSSVTVKHLSSKSIAEIPLPVPPIELQYRIVEEIEKQFSRLDEAIENLKCVKANLKRYKASVLKAAVEGKLTEQWRADHPDVEPASEILEALPKINNKKIHELCDSPISKPHKNWCVVELDQLIEYVTSGSRGWAKYYAESGDLFIRAQNLKNDKLELDDVAYVKLPGKAEGKRTLIQKSDILITITGANVTKTAIVNCDLNQRAYVNQHVALTRPVIPELSDYLFLWIICPSYGRKYLEKSAYGAGKPGLNLTNIKELIVALPPLAEQKQIVEAVNQIFTIIDKIEIQVDRSFKRADRLRQSILKKAFTGKIVNYG